MFWLVARSAIFPDRDVPAASTLAAGALALLAGGIWVWGARACWQRRYWRAGTATTLGFLPGLLATRLPASFLR